MEKRLTINAAELAYRIKDAVRTYLFENIGHAAPNPLFRRNPVVEMSRLNKRSVGAVPFPYNKFDIRIWSDDHDPPHFHVLAEGWDISFLIENGNVYRVNTTGKNSIMYNYIVKNVPIWLNMSCTARKDLSNKEYATLIWDSK